MNTDLPQPRSKLAARQAARERRAAMSAAAREAQSAAIRQRVLLLPEMQAATAVCVYVSFRDEVDTHELIKSILSSGKVVTLPKLVVHSHSGVPRIEPCTIQSWVDLAPGAYGILEPRTSDIYAGPIDLCVAPGLAFTERGDRLGYGRGNYDEFIARNPEMLVAGLAFEVQLTPELPTGRHDRPVQWIVTQLRTIRCGNDRM